MTTDTLNRFSSYRAACKQWSVGLAVLILLVGGLASLNSTKLLWAAGPLLFLGLVEAGYAAQERRSAEILQAKQDDRAALLPERASASVVRTTLAVLSLSIWPFYLGLFAIVAIGGEQMAASNKKALLANATQQSVVRTAPSGVATQPKQMSPQQAQALLQQAQLQQVRQSPTLQRLPSGAIVARPSTVPQPRVSTPVPPSGAHPVFPAIAPVLPEAKGDAK